MVLLDHVKKKENKKKYKPKILTTGVKVLFELLVKKKLINRDKFKLKPKVGYSQRKFKQELLLILKNLNNEEKHKSVHNIGKRY